MLRFIIVVGLILIVGLFVYRGCAEDGPMNAGPLEKAGEKVDDAVEAIGDWLDTNTVKKREAEIDPDQKAEDEAPVEKRPDESN